MALTADEYAELEWNQQMVAAIRAAMLGQATAGAQAMQFKGRAVTNLALDEQRKLLGTCQARITELTRKELGQPTSTLVRARF